MEAEIGTVRQRLTDQREVRKQVRLRLIYIPAIDTNCKHAGRIHLLGQGRDGNTDPNRPPGGNGEIAIPVIAFLIDGLERNLNRMIRRVRNGQGKALISRPVSDP